MAVENNLTEEKITLLQNQKPQHETTVCRKKGRLISLPFIIVNESFETVASSGLMPNMIFYLMNNYHVKAQTGAIILSLWSATSSILVVLGGFLSDSYLGRFQTIALGTFSSLLGTTMLWTTTMIPWITPPRCVLPNDGCESATPLQFLVLFSSLGLISIGAGCVGPCSIAFGIDQVDNKDNPNNARLVDSFLHWYYVTRGLSAIIAATLVVYIQDQFGWIIGFGFPVFLVILSLTAFLFGSPLYVHAKVGENLFAGLIQVIVAAYQKRKIILPHDDNELHYFHGNDSRITTPSANLRCLNKACVIVDFEREVNPDGTASNSWSLCPVERVEDLKSLARIIPMWSTGITMMLVAMTQTYFTLQANIMDRHVTSNFEIPAASFNVFSIVTLTLWVALYDRAVVPLLAKFFAMPRGLGTRLRMGLGLLTSCLAMIIAGIVESIRREKALVMNISALWLVPQLVLLGLAEALNAIGQIEFYYSLLPKSMTSLVMGIFTLGIAVSHLVSCILVYLVDTFSSSAGKESWLSRNLNKGHVDYYYWIIAFLSLVNFLYFLVCCRFYEASPNQDLKHEDEDSGYEDSSAA